jgi:hypothetical protein
LCGTHCRSSRKTFAIELMQLLWYMPKCTTSKCYYYYSSAVLYCRVDFWHSCVHLYWYYYLNLPWTFSWILLLYFSIYLLHRIGWVMSIFVVVVSRFVVALA